MDRRDFLKAGGAVAGTALAGCVGDDGHGSGKDDDANPDSYEEISFTEAELNPHEYENVRVEGFIQYDDRKQWWRNDDEQMLRTYQLYEDDPKNGDPDEMQSIPVVEYDEEPVLDNLPNEGLVDGDTYHVEVWGETDVLFRKGEGSSSETNYGDDLIKAHGMRRLDS